MSISLGADLIASMNGVTKTVTQVTGEYVAGVFVPETDTSDVLMSIQPLSGRDIVRIAEGDRSRVRWKAYCAQEVRLRDEMDIGGEVFQVESVEAWPNYWKAIFVRREGTGVGD